MSQLSEARDALRSLASYLTETGLRAQVAGNNAPAFTLASLVGMAATITQAFVAIEGAMGEASGPTQPIPPQAPPPAPTQPPPMIDMMNRYIDEMKRDAAKSQKEMLDNVRKQFEDMAKQFQPTTPAPPPAPTP